MEQGTTTRTGHEDEGIDQDRLALAAGAPTAFDPEAGMATAEYAIATLAAAGLAGLLIAILKSDAVRGLIEGVVTSAFSIR